MSEVDPVLLTALGNLAVMIIGPIATELLKDHELVQRRPAATLALICVFVYLVGWAVASRDTSHLAEYIVYSLSATGGGTLVYEARKDQIKRLRNDN